MKGFVLKAKKIQKFIVTLQPSPVESQNQHPKNSYKQRYKTKRKNKEKIHI